MPLANAVRFTPYGDPGLPVHARPRIRWKQRIETPGTAT
jgi:hypothetical protein